MDRYCNKTLSRHHHETDDRVEKGSIDFQFVQATFGFFLVYLKIAPDGNSQAALFTNVYVSYKCQDFPGTWLVEPSGFETFIQSVVSGS